MAWWPFLVDGRPPSGPFCGSITDIKQSGRSADIRLGPFVTSCSFLDLSASVSLSPPKHPNHMLTTNNETECSFTEIINRLRHISRWRDTRHVTLFHLDKTFVFVSADISFLKRKDYALQLPPFGP